MSFATALLALTLVNTSGFGEPGAGGGSESTGANHGPRALSPAPNSAVQGAWPPLPASISNAELSAWKGWAYLPEVDRQFVEPNRPLPDYTAVEKKISVMDVKQPTIHWRQKFVIFTSVDSLEKSAEGVYRDRFSTLESTQLQRTLASINRLKSLVFAATEGIVSFEPSISIEQERMFDLVTDQGPAGEAFLSGYLAPRINLGLYEDEDKVYRGPFKGVMVIHPASATHITQFSMLGTDVLSIPYYSISNVDVDGGMDQTLYDSWLDQVAWQRKQVGYLSAPAAPRYDPGFPFLLPISVLEASAWSEVTSFAPTPTETLLDRMRKTAVQPPFDGPVVAPSVHLVEGRHEELVDDPVRGKVLKYTEFEQARIGAAGTVQSKSGAPIFDLSQTPILSLWIKSSSSDRVALRLVGTSGDEAYISLGTDMPPAQEAARPLPKVIEVAYTPDGNWQQITVDLKPLAAEGKLVKVKSMTLGPTPSAITSTKRANAGVVALFDEFKVSADGTPTPLAGPDDTRAKATEAAALAKAGVPSPRLIALLGDRSDAVVVNACAAFLTIKDPAAEPGLTAAATSLTPFVGEMAIRALAYQGTESARAVLMRTLNFGISDHAKAVAGQVLAQSKEPSLATNLLVLLAARSWQAKLIGVQALGILPGKTAAIARSSALLLTDYQIKLAATQFADPADQEAMRRVLWSSVNEPSDMVRAWSNLKLTQSTLAEFSKEGYKGVRDDSIGARVILLNLWSSSPNEAQRPSIRLALKDASPAVRAAAVRAIGALEAAPTDEDLGSLYKDEQPDVLLELVQLAKRKGIKLPDDTLRAVKNSPDPRVVQAGKELPQ